MLTFEYQLPRNKSFLFAKIEEYLVFHERKSPLRKRQSMNGPKLNNLDDLNANPECKKLYYLLF